MKQTKAPKSTPSPTREQTNLKPEVGMTSDRQSAVFISMALDMSWRLALAVLVPIVGGFELDKRLHTTPLLTILGFVLAMIGMAFVLWRMLKLVNSLTVPTKEKHS
jgi:F0F1-type ATP synthase assembly protein I